AGIDLRDLALSDADRRGGDGGPLVDHEGAGDADRPQAPRVGLGGLARGITADADAVEVDAGVEEGLAGLAGDPFELLDALLRLPLVAQRRHLQPVVPPLRGGGRGLALERRRHRQSLPFDGDVQRLLAAGEGHRFEIAGEAHLDQQRLRGSRRLGRRFGLRRHRLAGRHRARRGVRGGLRARRGRDRRPPGGRRLWSGGGALLRRAPEDRQEEDGGGKQELRSHAVCTSELRRIASDVSLRTSATRAPAKSVTSRVFGRLCRRTRRKRTSARTPGAPASSASAPRASGRKRAARTSTPSAMRRNRAVTAPRRRPSTPSPRAQGARTPAPSRARSACARWRPRPATRVRKPTGSAPPKTMATAAGLPHSPPPATPTPSKSSTTPPRERRRTPKRRIAPV